MSALIFDTETHKLHGDIIEIGCLSVEFIEHGFVKEINNNHFYERYKPSEPISLSAMAVHLITDEDLEGRPLYTDFKFPEHLQPEYLIGHQIDYDVDAIERAGYDAKHIKRICTLSMSRFLWPKLDSHKLSAMALHVSRNRSMTAHQLRFAHNAIQDCKTTLELLRAICFERPINSMEELYQFSEMTRTPTHIFYGPHRGKAIADMSSYDLEYIARKSDDQYLLTAIQTELLSREDDELPFI